MLPTGTTDSQGADMCTMVWRRLPLTVGIGLLTALAVGLAVRAAGQPEAGTLSGLSVAARADGVVAIELSADRPLSGKLQVVRGDPTRVFLDLTKMVPGVVRVTEVNEGPVRRVRVGLNRAEPPVTRVVVDLLGPAESSLEPGDAPGTLSIVLTPPEPEPASATDADAPPEPTETPEEVYFAWFMRTAETVAQLLAFELDQAAAGFGQTEQLEGAWDNVDTDVTDTMPPSRFEPSHRLLTTVVALGRAAALSDGNVPDQDAVAARAGATLLLDRAQQMVLAAGTVTPEP